MNTKTTTPVVGWFRCRNLTRTEQSAERGLMMTRKPFVAAIGCIIGLFVAGPLAQAQVRQYEQEISATGQQFLATGQQVDRASQARVQNAENLERQNLAAIHADREAAVQDIMARLLNPGAPSIEKYQFAVNLRGADSETLYAISKTYSIEEANNILLYGSAKGMDSVGVISAELMAIGETTGDFVYTAVTPCRIVDTRPVSGGSGAILAGTTKDFYVYGDAMTIGGQGGNNTTGCPSPRGEPRAVHINATVVPQQNGNLRVYPQNVTVVPTVSLVNYKAGVDIANAGSIQTNFSLGPQEIRVFASGKTNVIIDVLGYYHEVDEILSDLVGELAHSGYDLAVDGVVNSGDPTAHFHGQTSGNSTLTFEGGEAVLVIASAQVYKDPAFTASNGITGSLHACYRDVNTLVVTSPTSFANWTAFCFSSTGTNDQRSSQISYLFPSMPPGTFQFGICAETGNAGGCNAGNASFFLFGKKINVISGK